MVKAKIILPAMLLLSALSGLSFQQKEVKTYLEFGDAQEEIFGAAQGIEIAHKGLKGKVNGALPAPMVGFQSKTHDEYVDIRFVAAINVTDLSNVTATWTRTNVDSNLVEGKQYIKESTKAYTALNIGNDEVLASSVGDYNYFVAYVIRNIPASASENYLDVKLTLQEGDDGVTTDVFSAKCDGTDSLTFAEGANTVYVYQHFPCAPYNNTFSEQKKRVASGSKVYTNPAPANIEINDDDLGNFVYTFSSWFEEEEYTHEVGESSNVDANAHYYARYICPNVLYYHNETGQVYTTNSADDVVVNENYVLYGEKILGYYPNDPHDAFNGNPTQIDLLSDSGVYRLSRNENTSWIVKRKIGFKTSLNWYDKCRFWTWSTAQDGHIESLGISDNTIYVDVKYTHFKPFRSDTTSGTEYPEIHWNDMPENYEAILTGNNNYYPITSYSSTNIYIYVWQDDYSNLRCSWGSGS